MNKSNIKYEYPFLLSILNDYSSIYLSSIDNQQNNDIDSIYDIKNKKLLSYEDPLLLTSKDADRFIELTKDNTQINIQIRRDI